MTPTPSRRTILGLLAFLCGGLVVRKAPATTPAPLGPPAPATAYTYLSSPDNLPLGITTFVYDANAICLARIDPSDKKKGDASIFTIDNAPEPKTQLAETKEFTR